LPTRSGTGQRLLLVASLLAACAATAGCGSAGSEAGGDKKPSELVLTAKDVGAPRSDDTGPTDLIGEIPEDDLTSVLPMSAGRPAWRAFGAAYKSVSIDSLAVALPSDDNAQGLLRLAPRLARYEGMNDGRVVRSLPIGDGAVLVRGRILSPVGDVRQGAAVVFREGGVVGQVIAQTDSDAIRLAKVQAAKTG
jgi:hypothetical protein